ncbi:MAG TPA: hypothetical protein VEX68_02395 [Bryobacteraceae bacterium]|nr:hypothetical protein [Bryobacteraceae bacterium]
MRRACVLLVLLGAARGVAEDPPRDVFVLARVRAHMSHLLQRLPNYTCLQTIERTRRTPSGKVELIDMVRLEVALVDGNELFAWPGSKKFQDTKIIDMVKGGAIGNGNFALHAKSVFQSSSPRFTYVGERIRDDGQRTLRWNFVVPQSRSGYGLRAGGVEAIVGYHGTIWVDATSLDAVRLEVYADDIPPQIRIHAASDAVDYVRVKLGEESFLLPSQSELSLTGVDRVESRNRTTFSGCRQYAGESTIRFDDEEAGTRSKEEERTLEAPAGLLLDVELQTPVTDNASAVGDPITAILKRSVNVGPGLVAPKGAFLHGRITHLRQQQSGNTYWVIGMTFFELEWTNTRAQLRAGLEATPSLSLLANAYPAYRSVLRRAMLDTDMFLAPGPRLSLRKGFPMHWRTKPFEQEDKQ